jgi:hypothetical protein
MPSIPTKKVDRVVAEFARPPKGGKRWSVRSIGCHAGVSHSTVQRIWSKNDFDHDCRFWVRQNTYSAWVILNNLSW